MVNIQRNTRDVIWQCRNTTHYFENRIEPEGISSQHNKKHTAYLCYIYRWDNFPYFFIIRVYMQENQNSCFFFLQPTYESII